MLDDAAVTFVGRTAVLTFSITFAITDRYLPMRELERELSSDPPCPRLTIVGRGRLGTALARAAEAAGITVLGPLGHGPHSDLDPQAPVLLCVPDGQITAAAAAIEPGPLVGHCSGATSLAPLGEREAFSLHPLMTATHDGARFTGAGAAVAGSSARALSCARELATALGMRPVEIAEADRPAYHAAASIASNFLITLEAAAERLAGSVGVQRDLLVPLVRAAVENWAAVGPERALTGPVARGDEATVAVQRAAVADAAPDLLALFDALVTATRAEAARGRTRVGVAA